MGPKSRTTDSGAMVRTNNSENHENENFSCCWNSKPEKKNISPKSLCLRMLSMAPTSAVLATISAVLVPTSAVLVLPITSVKHLMTHRSPFTTMGKYSFCFSHRLLKNVVTIQVSPNDPEA